MRFVLGGSERETATDLQNTHGFPSPRQTHHDFADEIIPGNQRPGHGCFVELQSQQEDSGIHA